jgi:hypothetical protein
MSKIKIIKRDEVMARAKDRLDKAARGTIKVPEVTPWMETILQVRVRKQIEEAEARGFWKTND